MDIQTDHSLSQDDANKHDEQVRLTEYSHGAGCGCKISPKLLEDILKSEMPSLPHPNLLVGNDSKDDAAVFDLGNGTSVVSTTDFFMPIVDAPFKFGQIAATNAISDIYAMGGTPLMVVVTHAKRPAYPWLAATRSMPQNLSLDWP